MRAPRAVVSPVAWDAGAGLGLSTVGAASRARESTIGMARVGVSPAAIDAIGADFSTVGRSVGAMVGTAEVGVSPVGTVTARAGVGTARVGVSTAT